MEKFSTSHNILMIECINRGQSFWKGQKGAKIEIYSAYYIKNKNLKRWYSWVWCHCVFPLYSQTIVSNEEADVAMGILQICVILNLSIETHEEKLNWNHIKWATSDEPSVRSTWFDADENKLA